MFVAENRPPTGVRPVDERPVFWGRTRPAQVNDVILFETYRSEFRPAAPGDRKTAGSVAWNVEVRNSAPRRRPYEAARGLVAPAVSVRARPPETWSGMGDPAPSMRQKPKKSEAVTSGIAAPPYV